MNFGNDVVVTIIVYSLIRLVIMTPIALELGKRRASAEVGAEAISAETPV